MVAVLVSFAGTPPPNGELKPRQVTFSAKQLALDEVLSQLQKQTGNAVKDARANRRNPTIALPATPATFWQTLDFVGKETGIGFSAYQDGGGVALVDRPYRQLKTDSRGVFRFAVKRVSVTRDEDADARLCNVVLDVAWEPTFRPLFVNVEQATAAFGKRKVAMDRQSSRPVAGLGATELDLRMPAPDRATAKIDALDGTLLVIGVPKLLDFRFAKLAAGAKDEQERVQISLADVRKFVKRWEIDLETEHPKGAIVELESFQASTWMELARVRLMWKDAKNQSIVVEGRDNGPAKKGKGTEYLFESRLPPQGSEVTLQYLTPNRVGAFTVPFAFRDLPLP